MAYTLAFGGDPQHLTITLSGRADTAGLHRLNADLIADPRFRAGLAILVDVSELDVSDLSPEALAAVVGPVVERDWRAPPLAVAIVAPDLETFETANLYRAHLGGSRSRRQVFSNHEQATEWLEAQRRS
jgi:hypothetical protein